MRCRSTIRFEPTNPSSVGGAMADGIGSKADARFIQCERQLQHFAKSIPNSLLWSRDKGLRSQAQAACRLNNTILQYFAKRGEYCILRYHCSCSYSSAMEGSAS